MAATLTSNQRLTDVTSADLGVIATSVEALFSDGAWVTAQDVAAAVGTQISFTEIEAELTWLVHERLLVTKTVPVYDTTVTVYRARSAAHACVLCQCQPERPAAGPFTRPLDLMSAPIRFLWSRR